MAHRRRGVGVGRTRANARPGGSTRTPVAGQRRNSATNTNTNTNNDSVVSSSSSSRGSSITMSMDDKLQKKADEMHALSIQTAVDTIEKLQVKLAEFAKKHQSDIQDDPTFRQQFLQMCAPLGVDPLVSQKGFWAKTLGVGIGDFYYELSVKVAEVCFATRTKNGGIMAVTEVCDTLNRTRSGGGGGRNDKKNKKDLYNTGDITIAVKKLSTLGGGFRIVTVGQSDMIVSVPTELDNDHMEIMTLAQDGQGCVTVDEVKQRLSWSEDRVERALTLLLHEGMAWKDDFHGISFYWFPSVWKEKMAIMQ
jgi:ESCRT-II complex subunit VPS22